VSTPQGEDATGATKIDDVEVTVLAINVTIPEALQWTGSRRGEEFVLVTLNVRLLPDGHVAATQASQLWAAHQGLQ